MSHKRSDQRSDQHDRNNHMDYGNLVTVTVPVGTLLATCFDILGNSPLSPTAFSVARNYRLIMIMPRRSCINKFVAICYNHGILSLTISEPDSINSLEIVAYYEDKDYKLISDSLEASIVISD